MKTLPLIGCALLCALPAAAQTTPDVGSGPVSTTIKQDFVRAYFRNNFQVLVSFPPLGDVKRLGATGLVQEFSDAAKTGLKYALIRATTNDTVQEGVETVFQITPAMYSYYSSVGSATAGYPATDALSCPAQLTNACQFIRTNANYALFVYSQATINGQNFAVRDPFYTKWQGLGGINSLGAVTGAEEAAASGAGTTAAATLQRFQGAGLYNITGGSFSGRLFAVKQPIWDYYVSQAAHAGFLGLPTGEELVVANDLRRQTFEGGAIEYTLGQTPVLRLPVNSVSVSVATPVQTLNLGDTVKLIASTYAGNGALLDGRSVTWLTSNSRVLTVDPSGSTVNVRAVGGGSASITAISEGKSSTSITFFVTAPCCQIGEGAPTTAIQQMFVDAVTRNRLSVRLPSPSPVRRTGNGYVQELAPADATSTARYYLAKPDSVATAYLVTGAILARYLDLGGPAGGLGFPTTDPTAKGRQLFEGGALGGSPAQVVTAPILTRWAAQLYENGPAGLPAGAADSALTFTATLGSSQAFAGGAYFAYLSGPNINKAYFVTGLILSKYLAISAARGTLGLPVNEEAQVNGRRRQDFEGGSIDYAPGDSEATVTENGRKPQISATPASVSAGTQIRIAAGGFPQGATLRITAGSQPDFIVNTPAGAYAWNAFVPANAPTGVVNLRAADVNGTSIAVGSYQVLSTIETLTKITKLQGDLQTGPPGARLAQPIRIAVKDESGNPVVGIAVKFDASPGAQIELPSATTDGKGEAQAFVRLPLAELPALATAQAGRQVVTFSARAVAKTLTNYPRLSQAGQTGDTKLGNESVTIATKGALLVSSASILRYLQNTGVLASPNGAADPLVLNQYLKDLCLFDSQGERICDGFFAPTGASERNVNLWRLTNFVNGNIDVGALGSSIEAIRDAISQGVPVLIALRMTSGSGVSGSHFVAGIGVNSGGGIVVHDPNPALSHQTLNEYLAGFTATGGAFRAEIAAAVQFIAKSPSTQGFLAVSTQAATDVASSIGACGFTISWPDITATGLDSASTTNVVRFTYCDGTQPLYQMNLAGTGQQKALLLDLATSPGRFEITASLPATYRLSRTTSALVAEPQKTTFQAAQVVNLASFTPDLAPGSLGAIFGGGLAGSGADTIVEIDGANAPVIASTPFQLNFRVPLEVERGPHGIRVRSPFGIADDSVEIKSVAPALFTVDGVRALAFNQDKTANTLVNPALRGQTITVYATGLGALTGQGDAQTPASPVTAYLEDSGLDVISAGLAPGDSGMNQVTVRLPADIPPGLTLRLTIQQGNSQSNPVQIAVQ